MFSHAHIYRSASPIFALIAVLLLHGCSTTQPADIASPSESRPEPETGAMVNAPTPVPTRDMSPEVLELLIEAELSAYRGETTRALDDYLRAARLSGDAGLIEYALQFALEISSVDRAMQAAVMWYEVAPENPEAQRLATQLLARVSEVESAWHLAEQSESPRLMRLVVLEASTRGDPQQVIWLDSQLLAYSALLPRDADLLVSRAIIADLFESYGDALNLTQQALSIRPDDAMAVQVRTDALVRLGQTKRAASELEQWLLAYASQVDDITPLLAHYSSMDSGVAAASLEQLHQSLPSSFAILVAAAESQMREGNLDNARSLYQEIAARPAYRDMALFRLGSIAQQQGDLANAWQSYTGIRVGAYYEEAQQRIVSLSSESDQIEALLEYYRQQRLEYPGLQASLYDLQQLLLAQVLSDEAMLGFLGSAISDLPDNFNLRYSRSIVAERLGELAVAEKDLRHILAADPDNATALNALGYTLTNRTDRHEEAYQLIERALELEPDSPAIQDSMGWVLYKLGDYEAALPYLAQAQSNFYDPEVIAHHAEVLWALDRIDEALDLIGQAMLDFPGNSLLSAIRAKIIDSMGNS